MRICNTKAMKLIKDYEKEKRYLINQENNNFLISYKEGEEKIRNKYDYKETRKKIDEIDNKVRQIKVALAKSNTVTKVDDFDITINEALVLLAQLENKKSHLEGLTGFQQLSRRITPNGVIEYTECLYDIENVKSDIDTLQEEISNLQIAIDRANLTSFIEI